MYTLIMALLNNAFFISYIRSKSFQLPLTQKEEQFYLEKKNQGDKEARDILIEKNLRLVAHIAKKYEANKELQEDLISIGTIGLIKAVDNFKSEKNIRLATYAARCIENEILMHLRSTKKTNAEVSLNEVLKTDKDGSEIVLEDLLPNNDPEIPDQIYHQDQINEFMNYFQFLSKKEQDILTKRYGLFNSKKYTQNEIAEIYHISRSYVSRIEKKALIRLLKYHIEKNGSSS
ncbi:RNA polymerase sporulation sigma factor SigK [[Clostridium] spiroforme]|nr:RNA polymerase sporulation sigma factor SigK [Thomasclavelia spiroformis]MBM6879793.1 RNA polymerase sporulation sigma factor SigK [Thomasclavelia spiroformis]MBM6930572.1 RNA polymerase sporulation sigma factor SigK [Thomasclavelia spiroformis]